MDHPIRGKVSQLPTHPNRLLDMEVDLQVVPQDTPVKGLAIMGVPHNLQGGTGPPILAMEVTQVVVISNHPKETMGILVHPIKDPGTPRKPGWTPWTLWPSGSRWTQCSQCYFSAC